MTNPELQKIEVPEAADKFIIDHYPEFDPDYRVVEHRMDELTAFVAKEFDVDKVLARNWISEVTT